MSVALADTTINVTVNTNEHTTFNAIQIFSGTQGTDSDDMPLGDVEWGDDVTGKEADIISAVNSVLGTELAADATALTVAKAISEAELTPAEAEKLAKALNDKIGNLTGTALTAGSTPVAAGWYLVVDKSTLGNNDALNASVLQFTKDITIEKKTDAPSQEKKVKEDSTYTTDNGYNDVADYDIGEEVPFQITSKIPDISKYAKYEMTFTDTMSDGLDFLTDDFTLTIGSTTYTKAQIDADENLTLTPGEHGFTLKLVVKKAATDGLSGTTTSIYAEGADITIDFKGKLNAEAVIGLPGNTNQSKLTYTNSPDADDEHDSTKDTPTDTVIVFTYELDVTKVDGQDDTKKLEGAEFVLKKDEKFYAVDETTKAVTWVDSQDDATVFTSPAGGTFAIEGLDEGTYSLVETKAPTGYNLLTDPISVVISAEYIEDRQAWDGTAASDALTATKISVDGEDATESTTVGTLEMDVQNNEGVVLPSTGGVGTTMFYVGGSILVLAAVILLVTKRRMGAND